MNLLQDSDTDRLLAAAANGDRGAIVQLMRRYRDPLERMVRVRIDPRIVQRVDPADVVQETLLDAYRRLTDYLENRPLPFFPWLRQLAYERLLQVHRRHLHASNRSVMREIPLPDQSTMQLAEQLVADGTSPSGRARRHESREHVRQAIEQLPARDREILVLRFLEQLTIDDVAGILGISTGAVSARQLRALRKLRKALDKPG